MAVSGSATIRRVRCDDGSVVWYWGGPHRDMCFDVADGVSVGCASTAASSSCVDTAYVIALLTAAVTFALTPSLAGLFVSEKVHERFSPFYFFIAVLVLRVCEKRFLSSVVVGERLVVTPDVGIESVVLRADGSMIREYVDADTLYDACINECMRRCRVRCTLTLLIARGGLRTKGPMPQENHHYNAVIVPFKHIDQHLVTLASICSDIRSMMKLRENSE